MNFNASTPAGITNKPYASSSFGSTGLTLVSHDAARSGPSLDFASTFKNANPTEFGMMTNKSIVYHFSTKSSSNCNYGPGAVLFFWRTPRRFGLDSGGDRSKCVADIFEMNEWFKHIETKGTEAQKGHIDSAEKVLHEISFVGVLKGAINGTSRERHNNTCIVNNVVGERASTVNLWGNRARPGTPLHLIVKKLKGAWRLVPYAGDGPPIAELAYEENGSTRIGTSMYIGLAISSPTAHAEGNENLIDDAVRSRKLAAYAGGIDVCLGV